MNAKKTVAALALLLMMLFAFVPAGAAAQVAAQADNNTVVAPVTPVAIPANAAPIKIVAAAPITLEQISDKEGCSNGFLADNALANSLDASNLRTLIPAGTEIQLVACAGEPSNEARTRTDLLKHGSEVMQELRLEAKQARADAVNAHRTVEAIQQQLASVREESEQKSADLKKLSEEAGLIKDQIVAEFGKHEGFGGLKGGLEGESLSDKFHALSEYLNDHLKQDKSIKEATVAELAVADKQIKAASNSRDTMTVIAAVEFFFLAVVAVWLFRQFGWSLSTKVERSLKEELKVLQQASQKLMEEFKQLQAELAATKQQSLTPEQPQQVVSVIRATPAEVLAGLNLDEVAKLHPAVAELVVQMAAVNQSAPRPQQLAWGANDLVTQLTVKIDLDASGRDQSYLFPLMKVEWVEGKLVAFYACPHTKNGCAGRLLEVEVGREYDLGVKKARLHLVKHCPVVQQMLDQKKQKEVEKANEKGKLALVS
jgi:hypothetical protein